MLESLKGLSDRATPGPWVASKWGYQILTGDSWNTICTFHSDGKDHRLAQWEDGRGAKDASSNSDFVAAIVTAWFAGLLIDTTGLAPGTVLIVGEDQQAALRTATSAIAEHLYPIIATALAEARAEGRRQGLEEAAKVADYAEYAWIAAKNIRSLATNTPETQKPETGESDGQS